MSHGWSRICGESLNQQCQLRVRPAFCLGKGHQCSCGLNTRSWRTPARHSSKRFLTFRIGNWLRVQRRIESSEDHFLNADEWSEVSCVAGQVGSSTCALRYRSSSRHFESVRDVVPSR